MFRVFFIIALSFMTVLYGLRFEKSRDLNGFATQLRILLDDELEEDGYTYDSRIKRMNQAVYLIHRAEEQRVDLEKLFNVALTPKKLTEAYRTTLLDSLLYNRRLAEDFGLFTPANLMRMEEGKMPLITRGGFEGEEALFDELVPEFLAPEASIDFANLRYCPSPMIDQKESLTYDHVELATRLLQAKVVSTLSYRRVLHAYNNS